MRISLKDLFCKFTYQEGITAEEAVSLQKLLDEVLPPEPEEKE